MQRTEQFNNLFNKVAKINVPHHIKTDHPLSYLIIRSLKITSLFGPDEINNYIRKIGNENFSLNVFICC